MLDGSLLLLGLSGPELTPDEAALFRKLQPAGYLLAGRNIVSAAQTRRLTDALRDLSIDTPILAIHQAGGHFSPTRNIAPALPSPSTLAARKDLGMIADAGALAGDLLRLLGCNLNLAPALDLDPLPDTPEDCGWGRDPQRVIDYAGQWNRWMRKRGVAACARHFPGCGRALPEPLHNLPCSAATLEQLLREDVIPFTALMPEIDAVMTGHVAFRHIDAEYPASLSPRIIRRFLRDQLGFDKHLVLTDDLDTEVIAKHYGRGEDVKLAITAGNDLALIGRRTDSAEAAARAIAELPHWMTEEARDRVERFRRKKLHGPLVWSDAKWESTRSSLAKLAAGFPGETPPAAD